MTDEGGRRYWVARHDDGEIEPLPIGFPLEFAPGKLPDGTIVTLELPTAEKNAA